MIVQSLADVQRDSSLWRDRNFPGHTGQQAFMGMVEEMGELSHHLLKRGQGIRGDGAFHDAEIKDACADLIIFMCGLAENEGFDLQEVLIDTWTKVRDRDWIKDPQKGVA